MTISARNRPAWPEQFVNKINAGCRLVGGILLIAMTSMILLQVGLRYVFNAPMAWAEEFSTACFIWMSFVGAIAATCQLRHIAIATFSSRLSATGRLVLHAVTMALIAGIATTLVVLALETP